MQQAKNACGLDGTVVEFSTAIAMLNSVFNPPGPDAWRMFTMMAFLSGNILVLEHILGDDIFLWHTQLTWIEDSLPDDEATMRMIKYKAHIEDMLKQKLH